MTPLISHDLSLGDEVRLSWSGSPDRLVARVHRLGRQALGPVLDVVLDDPSVAALGCGDLIHVATLARQFHGRVLHVETRWRTYGDRVVRAPSVLTVTAGSDLAEALQPRRFVRVACELDVAFTVGDGTVRGVVDWLSPRGVSALVRGSVPDLPDAVVQLTLPSGVVQIHGWVVRHEASQAGTRLGVSFTSELGIDRRLVDYVLQHGYTPVPAMLAG